MKGSQEGPADFAHDFRGSVLVGGWCSVRTEVDCDAAGRGEGCLNVVRSAAEAGAQSIFCTYRREDEQATPLCGSSLSSVPIEPSAGFVGESLSFL